MKNPTNKDRPFLETSDLGLIKSLVPIEKILHSNILNLNEEELGLMRDTKKQVVREIAIRSKYLHAIHLLLHEIPNNQLHEFRDRLEGIENHASEILKEAIDKHFTNQKEQDL